MDKAIIKNLVKLADLLDSKSFHQEANEIDALIRHEAGGYGAGGTVSIIPEAQVVMRMTPEFSKLSKLVQVDRFPLEAWPVVDKLKEQIDSLLKLKK